MLHRSYLGMYQNEAEKCDLRKVMNIYFGRNQTKKSDKLVVHVSPSTSVFLK